MNIENLSLKGRAFFCVALAERATTYLQKEYLDSVSDATRLCRVWMNAGKCSADTLCQFWDDEDQGFTLIQEEEDDEVKINAWNCIIDAIAIISRMAYESEGQIFFPEPIEMVDDSTFLHMVDSLVLCNSNEAEFVSDTYEMCLQK